MSIYEKTLWERLPNMPIWSFEVCLCIFYSVEKFFNKYNPYLTMFIGEQKKSNVSLKRSTVYFRYLVYDI